MASLGSQNPRRRPNRRAVVWAERTDRPTCVDVDGEVGAVAHEVGVAHVVLHEPAAEDDHARRLRRKKQNKRNRSTAIAPENGAAAAAAAAVVVVCACGAVSSSLRRSIVRRRSSLAERAKGRRARRGADAGGGVRRGENRSPAPAHICIGQLTLLNSVALMSIIVNYLH